MEPSQASRDRVRAMMRVKMRSEHALHTASQHLTPSAIQQARVWARVKQSMRQPAADLLSKIGVWLHPSHVQLQAVRHTMLARIEHTSMHWLRFPAVRLTASLAVFALLIRITPMVLLAPQSSAESPVLALPTRGTVEVSLNALWQPITDDLQLNGPTELRTVDGEATVILHDDGNVRLAENTHVIIRDLSDRPEEATVTGPSITLLGGKMWMQGFVPQNVRPVTVATPQGDIAVHGGSVAISVESSGHVIVSVWDRHAVVEHDGNTATLVAGEFARLTDAPAFLVQQSLQELARGGWVGQNLDRDAVHRRDIAQKQQERRAAAAGILPTSPLYTAKRIAEQMDLLMTFGETERVKKQLAIASTRLDEATALVAIGDSDVATPLQEYREALIAVATTDVGTGSVVQQLLAYEVQESVADIAAMTPNDSGYLIKKAVLQTSADLPDLQLQKTDVEATILVDTIDALQTAAASGDLAQVHETFTELKPYLKSVKEGKSELSDAARKEAVALLAQFADTVVQREEALGDVNESLLRDASQYLAPEPEATVEPLTDEQIAALVQQMKGRIYNYKLTRSRWNQLHAEFRAIADHPDRGRILRALYHELPENGLAPYVRTEIQKVRVELES